MKKTERKIKSRSKPKVQARKVLADKASTSAAVASVIAGKKLPLTRLRPLLPGRFEKTLPSIAPHLQQELNFKRNLARPRVSVVLVNRDGVERLSRCLFALKTQTRRPDEIVLVDNGSKDKSLEFVRTNYPNVKVLESQDDLGFAGACNLGSRYATGDLVAFMDRDAMVTPEWLGRLVTDFQSNWPKAGAIASPVPSVPKKGEGPAFPGAMNILGARVEGFREENREVFYPAGCIFLYPRYLMVDGPFDEDYKDSQTDLYFGWKLRLLGKTVRICPGAKAFRETSASLGWKEIYHSHRNRWMSLLIFYEASTLVRVLPLLLLDMVAGLLKSLGTGLGHFIGVSAAIAWIFLRSFTVMGKRNSIRSKRKVRDAIIVRSLSGRIANDATFGSRFLNLLSLSYCGFVGLDVLEFQED